VTLEQLRRWQAEGVSFAVIDARTGADIRRVLLA
jgi:polyhydroxyalkanoate synthesis regulator protein